MARRCGLCRLYRARLDMVCETGLFYAALDRVPVSPGHTVLFPKRHTVSVFDLSGSQWADMKTALRKATRAIQRANLGAAYRDYIASPSKRESELACRRMLKRMTAGQKPDAYNFGVNEGRTAGRTIDHFHMHIIPRYIGDAVPDGGVRHLIPE